MPFYDVTHRKIHFLKSYIKVLLFLGHPYKNKPVAMFNFKKNIQNLYKMMNR